MSLSEKIEKDYIDAYKNKDEIRVSTLRMLKSSIKNAEIAKKSTLNEDEVIKTIQREIKQRNDSIESFNKGNRSDLAAKEEEELKILKTYLPEQLSQNELSSMVKEAVNETGATSMSDFGKVMGALMPKIKGRADGNLVSQEVKNILNKNA